MIADEVRGFLRSNNLEGALELLIATWRDTRAVAVAELVDVIDALDDTPAFRGTTDAWILAARRAKTHRERGALIKSIAGRTAADTRATIGVTQTWHDPRTMTVILGLLHALPFSGVSTRDVWRLVFEVVRNHRDARFLHRADALVDGWNVGNAAKTFLTN